jgi:hypothetical protein
MNYEAEAIKAGATHVGEKGHGWVQLTGEWYVYQCGAGWVRAEPETELTPLVNNTAPTVSEATYQAAVTMAVENASAVGALLGVIKTALYALERNDTEWCKALLEDALDE